MLEKVPSVLLYINVLNEDQDLMNDCFHLLT